MTNIKNYSTYSIDLSEGNIEIPTITEPNTSSVEDTSINEGDTSLQFLHSILILQIVSSVAAIDSTLSNSAFNFKSYTGMINHKIEMKFQKSY